MFDLDRTGPTASCLPVLARSTSKELVKVVIEYINNRKKLPDSTVKKLSAVYGNFDRMVAAGWLLADAVGLPLLTRGDAYAAGLKARRESSRIKAAYEDIKLRAQRAASKLSDDANSSQRSELVAKAALDQSELLGSACDVGIFRAVAQAEPRPSGSRKRALEPETEPDLDQERDTMIKVAQSEMQDAEAAVDLAKSEVTTAAKVKACKLRIFRRVLRQLERCKRSKSADALQKRWALMKCVYQAKSEWQKAQLEESMCNNTVLHRQLALKDASFELLLLGQVVDVECSA